MKTHRGLALSGLIVFTLTASTTATHGQPLIFETLKADAIVCETDNPITLLSQSNLANQPGSVVMKRVAATAEFYGLKGQMNSTLRDLATTEQGIWKDSRQPDRGATSSRITESTAAKREAENSAKPYAEFMARCVATPPKEQTAMIVERRPISKAVRVRTSLNGREYELWTHDSYLAPQ